MALSTKSSRKLKLFEVVPKDGRKAKKWWLQALTKPLAFLVMAFSVFTILLGIAGLILPLVPGILLISVGISLMFYSLDRLQS
jgi:hypothetical protein